MTWEQKACEVIKTKTRLTYVDCEEGYVYVRREDGKIIPILEEIVAEWIEEDEKINLKYKK